jgi:diaminopimelate epimerase
MNISFNKMHGLGNDFIILDNRKNIYKNLHSLSKKLCDRRFGVGADQLLILHDSKKADFRMRIFNADGSEVEMCGNGIRCLAKYIWENRLSKDSPLEIETSAGIIRPERKGSLIRVDMGEPIFDPKRIPISLSLSGKQPAILNFPLKIKNKTLKTTFVSMGNPHAVIVVKDVNAVKLEAVGPLIENHKIFPKRTNVEFIQIADRKNIRMRVWERGAGETLACGTGASAAAVASSLLGLTDKKVTVQLKGGRILIEWSSKDNHIYMTGPAVKVFNGTIRI